MAKTEEERRRYLEFRAVAAALPLVLADTACRYAKQGVGPLCPGVDHVEGTVKDVIGPSTTASTSSHSTPLDILKLIDRKVKRRRR